MNFDLPYKDIYVSEILGNAIKTFCTAVTLSSKEGAETLNDSCGIRYFSGIKYPIFNGIFSFSDNPISESDFQKYLSEVNQYFSQKKVPYVFWWLQQKDIPKIFLELLDKFGFQSLGKYSGISVDINKLKNRNINSGLKIQEVISNDEYEKFIQIIFRVFEFPEMIEKDFKEIQNSYGPKGIFRHYLGYFDGQPATALTTMRDGKTVGLYNGATLKEYRKRGLCPAAIQYALQKAEMQGCEIAVGQLSAQDMARNLCEHLGFQEHCHLVPFVKM